MTTSQKPSWSMPHILLLIETFTEHGRGILRGINQCERENGPWSVFTEINLLSGSVPNWIKRWHGEGIISRSAGVEIERYLERTGLPMVELLGKQRSGKLKVHSDGRAVGRLAAEHLIDRGLRRFGIFTIALPWWVTMMTDGFLETTGHDRCSVHVCAPKNTGLRPHWNDFYGAKLTAWLKSLQLPIGIFTPSLDTARILLNTCREIDLAVPEQVAVITGDDDSCLCTISTPHLTAVRNATFQIGYRAASLLSEEIASPSPETKTLWIPPLGVTVRASTDVIAVDHADVVKAVQFIRDNFWRQISVIDVADHVALSRRTLERLFVKYLGHSPRAEIQRLQLNRSCELLTTSNLTVDQIAAKTGLKPGKYFYDFFRKMTGQTPNRFRKSNKN